MTICNTISLLVVFVFSLYIYFYICMYVCYVCLHACHNKNSSACMHVDVCMYVCNVCMYVCMYVCYVMDVIAIRSRVFAASQTSLDFNAMRTVSKWSSMAFPC